MQQDDIAALAKGMVPFVREVVAESNVIPPELALRLKAAAELLAEPLPQPIEIVPFDMHEPVRSVRGTVITHNGELAVLYSDGTSERLGHVIGPAGEKGAPGERGADGIGIKGDDGAPGRDGVSVQGVAIKGGELIVTLSDGSMLTPGRVIPTKK